MIIYILLIILSLDYLDEVLVSKQNFLVSLALYFVETLHISREKVGFEYLSLLLFFGDQQQKQTDLTGQNRIY